MVAHPLSHQGLGVISGVAVVWELALMRGNERESFEFELHTSFRDGSE